jgi:hypothetical protein
MRISTTQVLSVVLRPKNLEIETQMWKMYKSRKKTHHKYCAMKLGQIHRRIELCMREIILRFGDEFIKFTFLDSYIHIRLLKQVPKFLATGL